MIDCNDEEYWLNIKYQYPEYYEKVMLIHKMINMRINYKNRGAEND